MLSHSAGTPNAGHRNEHCRTQEHEEMGFLGLSPPHMGHGEGANTYKAILSCCHMGRKF